jgi:glycosyltransferase involved in cell wall biosynthesis
MITESAAELVSSVGSPFVSIVVPAFNSAAYLGEALSSLRAQTLSDIEIIVVDDGSTDGTGDVARRHAAEDPRVRVLTQEKPSGKPSCARNQALRVARGQYIAFLDADDISVPHRLESALHALELTGAKFAFADVRRLYQDTGIMAAAGSLAALKFTEVAAPYLQHVSGDIFLCRPAFPAYLLTHIVVNTPTVVFDRELLNAEKLWFDESLVCAEDIDLWFRWAEHTPIAFVDEVHSVIRKHASSLTASQPIQTHIDGVVVRSAHFKRLRKTMSTAEVAATQVDISARQFHVGYAQWHSGHGKSARSWFVHSWSSKRSAAAALGYLKSFIPRARLVAFAKALGKSVD